MSNSSNNAPKVALESPLADEHLRIVRLLGAMAIEWSDLSGKIAELGASLSAHAASVGSPQSVRDMQAFDALSQRALVQFRLLERICQELSPSTSDKAPSIDELVDALPFADLRQWLLAALAGEEPSHSELTSDEEESVSWFV
jgi:hypothetical protein